MAIYLGHVVGGAPAEEVDPAAILQRSGRTIQVRIDAKALSYI
jgi:hypothetical protein